MTVPISNMTASWTSSSNTYNAICMNVTTNAYAQGSTLISLKANSNTKFSVNEKGNVFCNDMNVASIRSTGNVLINRTTDSTVGFGVKLDVAGGINASGILTTTTSNVLVNRSVDSTIGLGVKLDVSGSANLGSIVINNSINEKVIEMVGTALNPANGTIQTITLASSSTFTDSLSAGQFMTLMIDDGTAYTITWPSVTWVNNGAVAPTLATSGYTVVTLWKVSTTLYGALVGDGT